MDEEAVYISLLTLAWLKASLGVVFAIKVIVWLDRESKRYCSIVAGFVNFFYFLGYNR